MNFIDYSRLGPEERRYECEEQGNFGLGNRVCLLIRSQDLSQSVQDQDFLNGVNRPMHLSNSVKVP